MGNRFRSPLGLAGRRAPIPGRASSRAAAVALLAALSVLTAVFAQSSSGFSLRRWVIGGGGGRTGGGALSLQGTLGQALSGRSDGGGYVLQAGFWHPAVRQATPATATSQFTPAPTATGGATPGQTPPTTLTPPASPTSGTEGTWTVTTTDDNDDGTCDAGHCSLREAIAAANAHSGPDRIAFRVPSGDPGCDASGVCTIRPSRTLSPLEDNATTIDGYTQAGARPNSAPFEQPIDAVLRIVLDGAGLPACCPTGLDIRSDGNLVRGLVIQRFQTGIQITDAHNNRIEGNFIGTDASGSSAAGNRCSGISASGLEGTPGSSGNVVGGSAPESRNLISGNGCAGVEIGPSGQNRVQGNYVGCDASGTSALPNQRDGVYIFNASQGSVIGGTGPEEPNLILHNGDNGIQVNGAAGAAIHNRLVRNRISGNGERGIALVAGGNEALAAPAITSASLSGASGSACPLCTVEVFADGYSQGRFYEGSAVADATGHWSISLAKPFRHICVTATVTDRQGNTSEFSPPSQVHGPPTITRTPAAGETAIATGTPGPTGTRAPTWGICLPVVRKESP